MKTIQLYSNGVGRYGDASPFIVTDNKLEISVELPAYNGEFYFAYANNSVGKQCWLDRQKTVTLENLTAGELNAEVKHYLKGELIKVYKVEPLLLKEADGSLSALPEMEEMRLEIASLKQAAVQKAEADKKLYEALNTKISSLMRFALKDYMNNVFLGGGTAEEFGKEFGFDLAEVKMKLSEDN